MSSTNIGGFVGAKKEEKSCKDLQVKGAMMGNWFVPARADTAEEQQLGGMIWSCGSGAEGKDWCVLEPGISLSVSSTPARGL